jgi:pimeloyl-ACP methyl ester carboxylesterase
MPVLERDGVKLFYTDSGEGRPPLLFVHGFGGDHTHFAPQLRHFQRNHRVVALDRRGHGQSDKPEQAYTIEGFADDVAYCVRELGLHKPVVVAHSMGVIGLELVARQPELAAALVVIDAPVSPPAPVLDAFQQALAGMRGAAWRDVIRGFADHVAFRPGDESELKARIVNAMCALPQHVLVSSWQNFLAYDTASAARGCRVPMLFLHAHMPADLDCVRALIPHAVIERIEGAGHFPQLEAPELVNAALTRFIAEHASMRAA